MEETIIPKPVEEVQTQRNGVLKVRELVLEDILIVASELIQVVTTMDADIASVEGGGAKFLMKLAQDKSIATAFKKILAQITDQKPVLFDTLPATDILKLVVALFKVNDFAELKKLFFVLIEMVKGQAQTEMAPE